MSAVSTSKSQPIVTLNRSPKKVRPLKRVSVELPKYSIGMGDRFGRQAAAQLRACMAAENQGCQVTPVWNKSNREHMIIGSEPAATRAAVEKAVRDLSWKKPYFVDADHIGMDSVSRFISPCDFFTIDVADSIGIKFDNDEIMAFLHRHPELIGEIRIPGIESHFSIDQSFVVRTARQFLSAVGDAEKVYKAIAQAKGNEDFVVEISVDETVSPQTPPELLIILAAIADTGVPIQTIAPKFTGRFNKGVDYVGDAAEFAQEFREDLATIAYAASHYGLPRNLKLSVHSGSDKFKIYPAIRAGLTEFDVGVHIKTAGTTWLEEVLGLAEAGGDALQLSKSLYAQAYKHAQDLCAPYVSVVDIDVDKLPGPQTVQGWTSEQFVGTLEHNEASRLYNPNFRQLMHVGFKMAARLGQVYTDALDDYVEFIAPRVTHNLLERHLLPIFPCDAIGDRELANEVKLRI